MGLAIALLDSGADPTTALDRLYLLLRRGEPNLGPLITAVTTRLGHIPEPLLREVIRRNDPALEVLARSGLSVQLEAVRWHAGEREATPLWVRGELATDRARLRVVARMFKHTTAPPSRFATAAYGTYERGWELLRRSGSPLSDDEFIVVATGICVYFLAADCGPRRLVRRARSWAQLLNLECTDERLAGKVDPVACSVGTYYAGLANVSQLDAVILVPINARTRIEGSGILTRGDLRNFYAEKHEGLKPHSPESFEYDSLLR